MLGRDTDARKDLEAARSLGARAALELSFLDLRQRLDVAGAKGVAMRIAEDPEQPIDVIARAWHIVGLAEGKLRRTQESAEALLKAEGLYRLVRDRSGLSQVRDTMGALMASLGRLDLAASHFMASLMDKAVAGDRLGMALTLGQMGRTHLRAGRFREAIECFHLDLELCRDAGDQRGEVRMLEDIGRAMLEEGMHSQAIDQLGAAAALAASRGYTDLEYFARLDLSRAHARCGSLDEARIQSRQAATHCPSGGEPYQAALLESVQGEIAWHARDRSCLSALQRSCEQFAALSVPDLEIPTQLMLAEALLHWGDRRNTRPAELRILRALRFATEDGYARFLPAIRQAMLALELAVGARDESRPMDWSSLESTQASQAPPLENGFVFLECLGEGAFGTTWRAYDARRHALVAVKRLKLDALYDPSERQFVLMSARMELRTASQVRHPGVARVLEIGDDTRGGTYVVQEFVDGPTLRTVMQDEPKGDLKIVLPVVADIARALATLHSAGTIHRDIKPENILLRESSPASLPVLIDFGLAQRLDLVLEQEASAMVGTIGYISPEQARGEQVGPATDVFALGVILFEWLAGTPPFQSVIDGPSTFRRVAEQREKTRPRSLLEVRRDVPPEIAELVSKMIDRRPSARPNPMAIAELCAQVKQAD
jgi:tetratricopeptide (TPR) repeat protein